MTTNSIKPRCLLSALLLGLSACVPAETTTRTVIQYDPAKTILGQIQQRGTLVVGVPDDFYPFGYRGAPPTAGEPSSTQGNSSESPAGFTVGLGRLVAESLGVKVRYLSLPSTRLLSAVDAGSADVVFPMVPVTEAALTKHPFSDPYFIAHQRLLVPQGSPIDSIEDLGGSTVCSAIDPNTELPLTKLDPTISLVSVRQAVECARPLGSQRVDAATAADAALLALKPLVPGSRIVGDQLTTEGYGAAVSACEPGLAEFISRVFAEAKLSGRWSLLYKTWVQPATGEKSVPNAPELTVVDASDLYPQTSAAPAQSPVTCGNP